MSPKFIEFTVSWIIDSSKEHNLLGHLIDNLKNQPDEETLRTIHADLTFYMMEFCAHNHEPLVISDEAEVTMQILAELKKQLLK